MAGELINKENYLKLYPSSTAKGAEVRIMTNGTGACYISAVSFYLHLNAYTTQGWDNGRSAISASIWYWNDDTGAWVNQGTISLSAAVNGWWGGTDNKNSYWSHNCDSGTQTFSKYHRWFVRFTTGGTNGNWSNYGNISLCYACHCPDNSTYNPWEKGKLIYGLEPTYETTSDTSPRPEKGGLSLPLRGTPINTVNGKYVFAK